MYADRPGTADTAGSPDKLGIIQDMEAAFAEEIASGLVRAQCVTARPGQSAGNRLGRARAQVDVADTAFDQWPQLVLSMGFTSDQFLYLYNAWKSMRVRAQPAQRTMGGAHCPRRALPRCSALGVRAFPLWTWSATCWGCARVGILLCAARTRGLSSLQAAQPMGPIGSEVRFSAPEVVRVRCEQL